MKKAWLSCLLLTLIAALVVYIPAFAEKTVTFTFTGDCTIGGTELTREATDSFDTVVGLEGYDYPFRYFRDFFSQDDCTVINLEGVLTDSRGQERTDKTFRFRGQTDFVRILTGASIDAATLANNHILDFGQQGLNSTKNTLTENGIGWAYILDSYIYEKDGIRIALISLDEVAYNTMLPRIRKEMTRLKEEKEADAIIVCFHSGQEYRSTHSEEQERRGANLIRYGADLVIMNHAHVVQGIRQFNNRTICYCLGNFVFGGNNKLKGKSSFSRTTTSRYSLVVQARLTFSDDNTYLGQQISLFPAFTSADPEWNLYQPFPVSGDDAAAVIDAVQYDTDFQLPEITDQDGWSAIELPFLSAENDE